jgi:HK97 family phage prohead protease
MPIDDTGNVIRARVENPEDFKPDSFRFIDIDKPNGIRAVIGIKKGKTKTSIQSYIFSKSSGWTIPKVKKWMEDHKLKVKDDHITDEKMEENTLKQEEKVVEEKQEDKVVESIDTITVEEKEVKEEVVEEKTETIEGKASVTAEAPTYSTIYDDKKNIIDYQNVKIEGYANTFEIDRGNDLVVPGAFKGTIDEYMKNPILLIDHNRSTEDAVGKVTAIAEDNVGLKITALISNAPALKDLRFKIAEGILKTFSIGGLFKMIFADDPKVDPNIIKSVALREISIVTVPMNQSSLFKVRSENSYLSKDEFTTILKDELSLIMKKTEGEKVKNKEVDPTVEVEEKTETTIKEEEKVETTAKVEDKKLITYITYKNGDRLKLKKD